MNKRNIYQLIFSLIFFSHVITTLYLIVCILIYSPRIFNMNRGYDNFVVREVKVIGIDDSGESLNRSILNIDNQKVYIDKELQVDSLYCVWYNNKTNQAYLRSDHESKMQFYSRKMSNYKRILFEVVLLFLILSIFDILNFRFIRPLT